MRLHADSVNREILKVKIAGAEDYTNLHLKVLEPATRPALGETAEKPNQKSDLEIFIANYGDWMIVDF